MLQFDHSIPDSLIIKKPDFLIQADIFRARLIIKCNVKGKENLTEVKGLCTSQQENRICYYLKFYNF